MNRTVVWDVDDVLNELTRSWLNDIWVPAIPQRVVRYEDLRENPPHALLGIGLGEYLSSLDQFRLSSGYARLAPNPEILAWLRENGDRCRHVALTATALRTAPTTADWVLRNFGRWIREFAFIPALRDGEDLPVYDTDKRMWMARLGDDALLIDDSPQNVAGATAGGVEALCWPQPWNAGGSSVIRTLQALTRFIDREEAQ